MSDQIPDETYLLSEFIYNRRTFLGFSRRKVAAEAGCSDHILFYLENCRGTPNWAICIKIFKALDTSLSEYAAWEKGLKE